MVDHDGGGARSRDCHRRRRSPRTKNKNRRWQFGRSKKYQYGDRYTREQYETVEKHRLRTTGRLYTIKKFADYIANVEGAAAALDIVVDGIALSLRYCCYYSRFVIARPTTAVITGTKLRSRLRHATNTADALCRPECGGVRARTAATAAAVARAAARHRRRCGSWALVAAVFYNSSTEQPPPTTAERPDDHSRTFHARPRGRRHRRRRCDAPVPLLRTLNTVTTRQ